MNKDTKASARMRYFDKTVFIPSVIENICSKNEQYMKQFLEKIGFSIGKDFVRQYPIGDKFVLDFAFVNEKICIEIDGEDHKRKEIIKKDKARDAYLTTIQWIVIRIKEKDLYSDKKYFYKNFIRMCYDERHEKFIKGEFYEKDYQNFKTEEDFI